VVWPVTRGKNATSCPWREAEHKKRRVNQG